MCCGGGYRQSRMSNYVDVTEYVTALYAPSTRGSGTLYSQSVVDQKTGRVKLISPSADYGDILSVPVPDVLARPTVFLSPCGEPFIIENGKIYDPCVITDELFVDDEAAIEMVDPPSPVDLTEAEAGLEAEFGKLAAQAIMVKLPDGATYSVVYGMSDEAITGLFSKRVAEIILRRKRERNEP